MMTRIRMKTKWKVLIFSRKINDWSRDFCHTYILYANANWLRVVSTDLRSIRVVFLQMLTLNPTYDDFVWIKMISFNFTDYQDRRKNQWARKWDRQIWINKHDDDKARQRFDQARNHRWITKISILEWISMKSWNDDAVNDLWKRTFI